MASALDDIESALRLLRDKGSEIGEYKALLSEISTAMADIVELLQKPHADRPAPDFKPIVDAIKAMKLTAPEVRIEPKFIVPAAPAPEIRFMPPEQREPDDWKTLTLSIPQEGGKPKVVTITKSK